MTEEKFWAFMEDVEQKFDYGSREILKNKTYEQTLNPPFSSFGLVKDVQSSYFDSFAPVMVDGIFRSGKKIDSFLRAAILIQPSDRDYNSSIESNSEQSEEDDMTEASDALISENEASSSDSHSHSNDE